MTTITKTETTDQVKDAAQNFRLPPTDLHTLSDDDLARWHKVATAKNEYWHSRWRHPNSVGWAQTHEKILTEIQRRKSPTDCIVVAVPAIRGPEVICVAADIAAADDLAKNDRVRPSDKDNVPRSFRQQYYRVDNRGNVRIVVANGETLQVKHPSDDILTAGFNWLRAESVKALLSSAS